MAAQRSFVAMQDFLTSFAGSSFAVRSDQATLTVAGFVETSAVNIPLTVGIHTVEAGVAGGERVTTVFETIASRPTFEIP